MSALAPLTVFALLLAIVVIVALAMTIKIVPQGFVRIVERLGKYRATLSPGANIVVPFIDRVAYTVDMREQVVSFQPQSVITEDNLDVSIDTVIYFKVHDPVSATYEIANYIIAIEQLTMTTLRNIIGGMTLEHALTSRDRINQTLRGELDAATGRWGIRVERVELKGIEPPVTIKDAMEQQMRADRNKRAVILTAEGARQSAILTAEGEKQAQILRAEGDRQSQVLRAQGEGQAIQTVFQAIHDGNPDQKLLAYQYLQMLPEIANSEAATMWIVPAELTKALESMGGAIGKIPIDGGGSKTRVDADQATAAELADAQEAVESALEAAEHASSELGDDPMNRAPRGPAAPDADTPPPTSE